MNVMIGTIVHRYLRVPYTLHVQHIHKPKKPRGVVLFIHGIGNSGDAWSEVIEKLPRDVGVIAIDLLGFGDSPKPEWAVYSAKVQARSVLATYFKLRITSPVIIVGHSLGSLVAIEIAKRYPLIVKSLILCSPPLYDTAEVKKRFDVRPDSLLRQLYSSAYERPDEFVKLSSVAMKYNLINKSFNVTSDNVASYMATLQTMIINQTSLHDAQAIKVPTTIIHGTLDPVVIAKNLKLVVRTNPHVALTSVLAGHEVRGLFVGAVVRAVQQHLPPKKKRDINGK